MIMFRKTHEAVVKRLEDTHAAYVNDLNASALRLVKQYEDRIEDLRRLVFPATPLANNLITLEADAVMSGSEKPVAISEEEHHKMLEQAREVDLLFSGNYSEDLLQ